MDTFVVFFDPELPFSHFGWGGAFCGAEPAGELTDRHGWSTGQIRPCPACLVGAPLGSRHIFRSSNGAEALCGALRQPERPIEPGIDPSDPELCDRCLVLHGASYRILDAGASASLLRPGTFVPRPLAV